MRQKNLDCDVQLPSSIWHVVIDMIPVLVAFVIPLQVATYYDTWCSELETRVVIAKLMRTLKILFLSHWARQSSLVPRQNLERWINRASDLTVSLLEIQDCYKAYSIGTPVSFTYSEGSLRMSPTRSLHRGKDKRNWTSPVLPLLARQAWVQKIFGRCKPLWLLWRTASLCTKDASKKTLVGFVSLSRDAANLSWQQQ